MKHIIRFSFLCTMAFTITACSDARQMFWEVGDTTSQRSHAAKAESRAPLELPPELRADVALPMANDVASSSVLPEKYNKAVAGTAVALNARVYDVPADQVFSAIVDAMTSLNLPVDSVDSPSGIVTSDWVRKGANNNNIVSSILQRNSSDATRYRYIVRIFRLDTEQPRTRLEVRMLNQVLSNMRWRNKAATENLSLELFSAVEDQLARLPWAGQQSAVGNEGTK